MRKRRCRPVEQWIQLHLWPDSEDEIQRRRFIAEFPQIPYWKDWKPEVFRAGASAE